MDAQYERLYEPGQAQVYPLPERQPWETFQSWGMPPGPLARYPLDDERSYVSPGPPPWAQAEPASGVPVWVSLSLLAGVSLACGSMIALSMIHGWFV